MSKQKYQMGDHVRVTKDLGAAMSHFTADCDAIVIGSYVDQYGGGERERHSYTLHLKGRGRCSWYDEWQLELIEANRCDLLREWKEKQDKEAEQKSDLDWIFSHGEEALKEGHGSTVAALAECFGLTNLWGTHGEGITYFTNALRTMAVARPFLEDGDKEGWLKFCAAGKAGRQP